MSDDDLLFFDDSQLTGCVMMGNKIMIDNISYSVVKGDKTGIWCLYD